MGLFDGMLGNAAKIDPAKIQQEFAQLSIYEVQAVLASYVLR